MEKKHKAMDKFRTPATRKDWQTNAYISIFGEPPGEVHKFYVEWSISGVEKSLFWAKSDF